MSEIQVTRYKCDVCGKIFNMADKMVECEAQHAADEEICTVGNEVVVDVGGPGAPSMMGGLPGRHEAEYVTGRTVEKRDYGKVLVELADGERMWCSGWALRGWAKEKASADYYAEHREEIEKSQCESSGCSVIVTLPR